MPTPPRPYVSAEMLSAGAAAAWRFSRSGKTAERLVIPARTLIEALPAIYRAMAGARVSRDATAAERQRRFRAKHRPNLNRSARP